MNELDIAVMNLDDLGHELAYRADNLEFCSTLELVYTIRPDLVRDFALKYASRMCTVSSKACVIKLKRIGMRFAPVSKSVWGLTGWRKPKLESRNI